MPVGFAGAPGCRRALYPRNPVGVSATPTGNPAAQTLYVSTASRQWREPVPQGQPPAPGCVLGGGGELLGMPVLGVRGQGAGQRAGVVGARLGASRMSLAPACFASVLWGRASSVPAPGHSGHRPLAQPFLLPPFHSSDLLGNARGLVNSWV